MSPFEKAVWVYLFSINRNSYTSVKQVSKSDKKYAHDRIETLEKYNIPILRMSYLREIIKRSWK